MSIVSDTLRDDGQCLEALYPYAELREAPTMPSSAAAADAKTRLVAAHTIKVAPGIDDVRTAVASGVAAVLGIEYYESSRVVGARGVIPIPSSAEPGLGGHAVLVAGYDDDRRQLLVRNSWGEAWGESGYGWLPYDYPALDLIQLWTFAL
jgi:C1A family cysteine protease